MRTGREEQVETKGGEGGCNVFHGVILKGEHCLPFVALWLLTLESYELTHRDVT